MIRYNIPIYKIEANNQEYKIGDEIYLSNTIYGNYHTHLERNHKAKIISFEYINEDIKVNTDYNKYCLSTIRAINLIKYNNKEVINMETTKVEKINSFKRNSDNSVWIRQGDTDTFRYKSFIHSFDFLNGNKDYKAIVDKKVRVKLSDSEETAVKQKVVYKNSDKKAILEAIDECRKQDFDEEEQIYDFIKKYLNLMD